MAGAESGSVSLIKTGKYPTLPLQGPFTMASKLGESLPLDYSVIDKQTGGKTHRRKYAKRKSRKKTYKRRSKSRNYKRRVKL